MNNQSKYRLIVNKYLLNKIELPLFETFQKWKAMVER